jgi:CrcB protein
VIPALQQGRRFEYHGALWLQVVRAVGQALAIAAGGALGALCRFWMSTAVYGWLGRGFPYGTLAVNVVGSLLMGLLFVLMIERLAVGAEWRAFWLVGVLGAFTTFSTFSVETLALIEQGEFAKAALNSLVSVVACIGAAFLGAAIARQL